MIRRVFLTGGGSPIGHAVAVRLAREGCDIAMISRNSSRGLENSLAAVEAEGRTSHRILGDVMIAGDVEQGIEAAKLQMGGLDTLVHLVGDYADRPLTQMTSDQWNAVQSSNLGSAFNLARCVAPIMRDGAYGRMVFFASAGAEHMRARGGNAAYMIAKSGLIILARSLARELAGNNITVNVVSPGIVESSFEFQPEYTGLPPTLPMGRPAYLTEIADAVWQFVRPEAEYTTGQTLDIAGGWLV